MATIDWTKEQVRGTFLQMQADNVTLEAGQLGYETDNRKGKVGPGAYNSLPYESSLDIAKVQDNWEDDQRDGGSGGGGATNTDELTNNSTVSGATTTDALNTLLGADQELDEEKQDKLLSILTINDDNHTLTGTEYFIRATGSDPTWVTDTGDLDPGYPLELANDSTNVMTFVPDSGSNIVLSPGDRASLRHRSGGAWVSMFSGVDTALAAKADVYLDGTIQDVQITVTGVIGVSGYFVVDLSTASGGRPALATAHFVSGSADTLAGIPLVGYVSDATLATFTVSYFNVIDLAGASVGDAVQFTVIGTKA